ncbi:LysR family transcriptional regulator [Allokutzneria sp. A3M-2-11 16]|uniref:LysR family transcriptional regulator n=1 Tax=Allokutzneria sp. A3M-2-11 16 TaxID=2962043 RepID=UPI0020B64A81|nr:LysR family transcriptional regulator [Allokutzneria sp. A3M-2-11 16]MCP3802292.1 LysR family transcriptional regulator [Allokutzneria sp. A3M-2-11 16]
MIDVQRLRVLTEVARHGSFSKAAAALLFTPSAVSQQIAALERTVGTEVVLRSARGVTLTDAGRLLVDAGETISAELRHTEAALTRLATGVDTLTIATFSTGGRHLLPSALARLAAEHPNVEITVLEREPEDSVPLVRSGAADLALAYEFDKPLPLDRLTFLPVMDDPMSVVLRRDHALASKKSLSLNDIADQHWVFGCSRTAAFLHRYAEDAGFSLRVSASTTDYFFAQALVEAGVGIALIPLVALRKTPSLVVIPVARPRPARRIGVVVAARARSRPPVATLVDALRSAT